MNFFEVAFFIVFCAAFVFFIAYLVHLAKLGDKILQETASRLGGKRDLLGRYVISKNGSKYWYAYSPPGKNNPSVLKVTIPCSSRGEFAVVLESEFDKTAKKLGFSSELQTGDKDFDANYYILSDTVDFARIYFQSTEKRELIKKIYDIGFNNIKHDGKTVEITWIGFEKNGLSTTLITETADCLFGLSKTLPDYFADQMLLGIPRMRFKTITAYTIPSLTLFAAAIAWFWIVKYPPLDNFAIFIRSLLLSIPLFILYIVAVGFAIRGRAASHKDFVKIVGISAIAFLLFANNGFILINGLKDFNKPAIHNTVVTSKYLTRHKNSTTYHIIVSSWRPGHNMEEFTITGNIYSRIEQGKTEAIFVTKPGALGFEWVVSKEFKKVK
ncbi:MAG: hypothetical protein KJ893_10590 [Candidatus Omnitrophica bacterium]|nr:hypothetical protein [Candidatus Omnitrophota bacterium]